MMICDCGKEMMIINTSDGKYYYCNTCGKIIIIK